MCYFSNAVLCISFIVSSVRYLDFDLFVGFCIDCDSLLAEVPRDETSASRE